MPHIATAIIIIIATCGMALREPRDRTRLNSFTCTSLDNVKGNL